MNIADVFTLKLFLPPHRHNQIHLDPSDSRNSWENTKQRQQPQVRRDDTDLMTGVSKPRGLNSSLLSLSPDNISCQNMYDPEYFSCAGANSQPNFRAVLRIRIRKNLLSFSSIRIRDPFPGI
jgi:hypothetical protein